VVKMGHFYFNPSTGLSPDALNSLMAIQILYKSFKKGKISDAEFEKRLSEPIPMYANSFVERGYQEEVPIAIKKANPIYRQQYNEIIECYNNQPLKTKKNFKVFEGFLSLLRANIEGKINTPQRIIIPPCISSSARGIGLEELVAA